MPATHDPPAATYREGQSVLDGTSLNYLKIIPIEGGHLAVGPAKPLHRKHRPPTGA